MLREVPEYRIVRAKRRKRRQKRRKRRQKRRKRRQKRRKMIIPVVSAYSADHSDVVVV